MLNSFFHENRQFSPLMFSTFEKPKSYDYIPESYKVNWEDPHLFIPRKLTPHYNQRMYLNLVHRECFNSCVTKSADLTENERNCYDNCQNKHLNTMGIFKDILLATRKWKGWKNFVSLREYSRDPDEMATTIPTDPMLKGEYEKHKYRQFCYKAYSALNDLFVPPKKEDKEITIFEAYMNGYYTKNSKVAKSKQPREDMYNEYKELSEKYGDQIKELVKKKVDLKDWKDVPGSDWVPEEEPEAAIAEEGPTGEETSLGEESSE